MLGFEDNGVPVQSQFLRKESFDFAGMSGNNCWDYYEIPRKKENASLVHQGGRVLKGFTLMMHEYCDLQTVYSEPLQSSDSIGFRVVRNASNDESSSNIS